MDATVANQFGVYDYVVLVVILLISLLIGLFFAWRSRKKYTTNEVLLGSREMNVIPAAMSLLASFISAIALVGTSSEIYVFGTQYMIICVAFTLMVIFSAHMFIPVFYNLGVTSVNEYLEMRFHRSLRIIGAICFLFQMSFYIGVVLYTPALALNVVTGINTWIIVVVAGTLCSFYTALGGMKAVMWTDTFQVFVMFVSLITVLVQGSLDHGSFTSMWNDLNESGRVEFLNLDPNPLVRHTFWSVAIGGGFAWTSVYGSNQAQVQRALSLPKLKYAKMAMWVNLVGLIAMMIVLCLVGTVLFAEYKDCDPLNSQRIRSRDQLLPLYVMEKMAYPGVPGLFIAGIFSGALSTISSGLNSLAAITLIDIIPLCPCGAAKNLTDKQATTITKVLPLFFGAVMMLLTYIASALPGVLQGTYVMFGVIQGPLFGVFLLGMVYPWANWKGALSGFILAFLFNGWVGISGIIYRPPIPGIPPRSIESCPVPNVTAVLDQTTMWFENFTTTTEAAMTEPDDILPIYSLSYLWMTPVACIIVTVVGLLVSFITGANKADEVDPRLIVPIAEKICCCLPERMRRVLWCGVRHDAVDEDQENEKKVDEDGIVNSGADEAVTGL